MDRFRERVQKAGRDNWATNYRVVSLSSNSTKMLRMLDWARALRNDGVHVAIIFANNALTVSAPVENYDQNPPF